MTEAMKLFRDMFRDKLEENGFFWKNNGFYRIDHDVVLKIDRVPRWEICIPRWGTMPFCLNWEEDTLKRWEPFIEGIKCLVLDNREKFRNVWIMPRAEQLEWTYQVFMRDEFEAFSAVHDVESNLAYLYSEFGHDVLSATIVIWHYLYMKQYTNAAAHISKELVDMQDDLQRCSEPPSQRFIERYESLLQLQHLIETGNTQVLENMVSERVIHAKDICRKFFGKKYKD